MNINQNSTMDISTYKTLPCKNLKIHKKRECPNYHSESEKRRNPKEFFYNKIICNNYQNCNNKNCQFSHSIIEQLYHPENYKKKFCKSYFLGNPCNFGVNCALAHSENELEIRILHHLEINDYFLLYLFKSEFCPFNKFCPDKFKCVYAHNWQDFKRPYDDKILPIPCKNWNKNSKLAFYIDGCENGFKCTLCHGWKEYDYHLKNFKKNYCKNGKGCKRKSICSFLHNKILKKNKNCSQSDISTSVDTPIKNQQKKNNEIYCLKSVKKFLRTENENCNSKLGITKNNSTSQIESFKNQNNFRFKKNRKRFMVENNDSFEKEEKVFSFKNVKKSINNKNDSENDKIDLLLPNLNFNFTSIESESKSKFVLKKNKSENFNFENICRFFK